MEKLTDAKRKLDTYFKSKGKIDKTDKNRAEINYFYTKTNYPVITIYFIKRHGIKWSFSGTKGGSVSQNIWNDLVKLLNETEIKQW